MDTRALYSPYRAYIPYRALCSVHIGRIVHIEGIVHIGCRGYSPICDYLAFVWISILCSRMHRGGTEGSRWEQRV